MALVLKTGIVSKTIEGSNPSLSFSHFLDKYYSQKGLYIYEIECCVHQLFKLFLTFIFCHITLLYMLDLTKLSLYVNVLDEESFELHHPTCLLLLITIIKEFHLCCT